MKNPFKNPITIVLLFLLGFMLFNYFRNELMLFFVKDNEITVSTKYFIISAFNVLYTIAAFLLIKNYKLINLAGLGSYKFKNWFLLLFPLYIVLINLPDSGEINFNAIPAINYIALLVWALSVGFSEEFMLRGFIQSLFIKHYGTSKRRLIWSVIGGALIFGLMHLIKFDKGLFGEITQVLYATFIGTMFGALLLRTNKIWPLIALHALIDIVGNLSKFQETDTTVKLMSQQPQEFGDSLVIVIVLLPCFIYGLVLLRRVKMEEIVAKKSVSQHP